MKKIQAVIFDMDGLMLDTESISASAWHIAGKELNAPIPEAMIQQMTGRSLRDIRQIAPDHLPSEIHFETLWIRADYHYNRILHEEPIRLKPGLLPLLDELDACGIPKSVATSSRLEQVQHKLSKTGLLHRFEHLTTSEEVVHGKPAPDIFLRAAQKFPTPPEHCLVLEDSIPGITGAFHAGMQVIWVPEQAHSHKESPWAHYVADNLAQAQQWLRGHLL